MAPRDVSLRTEFDRLYSEHSQAMIGQVFAMTGDLGAAQDAVQEAWIKAWLRWDKVRTYDRPASWVLRVALNNAVSGWRRTKRNVLKAVTPDRPGSPPPFDPGDQLDLLRALQTLPPEARRIVVLHHMAGYSVEEIAAAEGVAVGTVKSRLSRARGRLSQALGLPTDSDPLDARAGQEGHE